jgi:hypothetical protein
MAANWLKKHFRMKPEVSKIFDDIEDYKNYCRDHMLKFDEKDLYKTPQYHRFEKQRSRLAKQHS